MQTSANPAVTSCRQIPLRRCFQHVIFFRDIFQMSGHFYHLLLLLFPVVHLMHVYLPFEFIYHHKSSLSDSHWCHWMKRPVESWRANSEIMVFLHRSASALFTATLGGSVKGVVWSVVRNLQSLVGFLFETVFTAYWRGLRVLYIVR